ncbi:MAG: NADH-quinone oxidoreductase subunit L [Actinomycetia bacterium]|nr:NADH-quinone oxidoreductase subunit L [Actinomycetes bacterium]
MTLLAEIVGLPLLGAASLLVFKGILPRRMPGIWASALVGAAFALSWVAMVRLAGLPADHRVITGTLFTWANGFGPAIGWRLYLDPLSAAWILIVTGVGFLIHVYSNGYMADDPDVGRFFAELNLFVFSMLVLVLAGNLLVLLIGWALVGLSSYLLIGFWYERASAVQAAKKAFVVNTVGDVAMLLALVLLWLHYGTLAYGGLFAAFARSAPGQPLFLWTALLLYVGAMAKSAQFPLHIWLPDAMEGPTPVSALIHAATMVTAGVYLVARIYPLFRLAPGMGEAVAAIGALTALFAASVAVFQQDIKRALAYSTVSQLGYMFMAVGVGAFAAGVFHFMTHAFFKALLFMAAGSVIHALAGEQDLGAMGGLWRKMPWTAASFLVATLAIAGIPGFSGFFSKEAILGQVLALGHTGLWLVGALTAGLTAFYMFRVFFLTFLGRPRDAHLFEHAHEAPWVMTVPVVVLAVLSVLGDGLGGWLDTWLAPTFTAWPGAGHWALGEGPLWATGVVVLLALAGIAAAYALYVRREAPAAAESAVARAGLGGWGLDTAWAWVAVLPAKALGDFVRWANGGFVAVVDRVADGVLAWAEDLRPIQTGQVRRYTLSVLVGTAAVLAYFLVRL